MLMHSRHFQFLGVLRRDVSSAPFGFSGAVGWEEMKRRKAWRVTPNNQINEGNLKL